MDVLSRPLAAYYAVLNLSKAWLTLQDPAATSGKLRHGAFRRLQGQVQVQLQPGGIPDPEGWVFGAISERSGQGYAYTTQKRPISELAAFLVESHQDYESSINKWANVLPLRNLEVLRGTESSSSGNDVGALWMRAQVDRGLLASREIPISKVPTEAYHFGQVFTQKASTEDGCLTYESSPVIYGKNTRHAIPGLIAQFEESLLHLNRGGGAERYFVVLSPKKQLLSQEAVSFVVMLHLSNMVRYRPEQVEKVATDRWSWLLSTWSSVSRMSAVVEELPDALERRLRPIRDAIHPARPLERPKTARPTKAPPIRSTDWASTRAHVAVVALGVSSAQPARRPSSGPATPERTKACVGGRRQLPASRALSPRLRPRQEQRGEQQHASHAHDQLPAGVGRSHQTDHARSSVRPLGRSRVDR